MLVTAKELKGYRLRSLDGEIGKVEEFYFDDTHWAVRYIVAETGNWLKGREVLISPYALKGVDKAKKDVPIQLTRKQIEESPPLESHKPVSRQFEESYHGYYGFPAYWGGPNMWGSYAYIPREPKLDAAAAAVAKDAWDPHLRSTAEVSGYHVQATDGAIGHVKDFIIDDTNWAIRYLVVDASAGKKVLVSPRWIKRVSWDDRKVFVTLTQDSVKTSPEYTEESLPTREYETSLHGHYNQQGYWVEKPAVVVRSR